MPVRATSSLSVRWRASCCAVRGTSYFEVLASPTLYGTQTVNALVECGAGPQPSGSMATSPCASSTGTVRRSAW